MALKRIGCLYATGRLPARLTPLLVFCAWWLISLLQYTVLQKETAQSTKAVIMSGIQKGILQEDLCFWSGKRLSFMILKSLDAREERGPQYAAKWEEKIVTAKSPRQQTSHCAGRTSFNQACLTLNFKYKFSYEKPHSASYLLFFTLATGGKYCIPYCFHRLTPNN